MTTTLTTRQWPKSTPTDVKVLKEEWWTGFFSCFKHGLGRLMYVNYSSCGPHPVLPTKTWIVVILAVVEPTTSTVVPCVCLRLRLFAIFLLVQIFIVEERRRSSRLRIHQQHVHPSARCLTAASTSVDTAYCCWLFQIHYSPHLLYVTSQ